MADEVLEAKIQEVFTERNALQAEIARLQEQLVAEFDRAEDADCKLATAEIERDALQARLDTFKEPPVQARG